MSAPRIFQIHYKPEQIEQLDHAFTPYDNAGVQDPLLEYSVLRRIHREGLAGSAGLWGAVSWKFGQKTGLSGAELLRYLQDHPGFDVYYCNPFPEFEGLYHNLWLQGEAAHPKFVALVDEFMRYAGLGSASVQAIYPSWAFAAANYIVASPAFWQAYTGFMDQALDKAYYNAPAQFQQRLQSAQADAKGLHAGAGYLPFVVERLFMYFLTTRAGKALRMHKYPLAQKEARLNVHLKRLREMKDLAWKIRSDWMASCWINYRNLYLTQFYGKEWLEKYLLPLNPRKMSFADLSESAAAVAVHED
jgi:hypothetical protein